MPSSTTFGLTEHLPGLLLAAGVSLLSFLVLMNLRFKLQRRAASRHVSPAFAAGVAGRAAGEFQPADHLHHGGRGSSGNQPATIDDARVVEAHESVRHLINALDTRCRTLEILLRQADDRIRQLEDALDDRVGASISPTRTALPGRARRTEEDEHATPSTDPVAESEPADDARRSPRVEVTPAGAAYFHAPIDPLTANVYELADRGRSPLEIARYLDEQVGKVELILALRGDH